MIYWSDNNGKVHHGNEAVSFDLASEWLLFLKKTYPDIQHWIEKVKPSETP